MKLLYASGGARDFRLLSLNDQFADGSLMSDTRRLLKARGQERANEALKAIPFELFEATNHFNDEFNALHAGVDLTIYEDLKTYGEYEDNPFATIADTITEIGPYVRIVAVDLDMSSHSEWDVFICHASEDKNSVVRPIVNKLDREGVRCWYDEGEIKWGDSLLGKIREGLSKSRFVIVVLSESFLEKDWPNTELESALNQEVSSGDNQVLPLLVGNERQKNKIEREHPIVSRKKYVEWNGSADEVYRELRRLL